jgi:hypothetical protein
VRPLLPGPDPVVPRTRTRLIWRVHRPRDLVPEPIGGLAAAIGTVVRPEAAVRPLVVDQAGEASGFPFCTT